MFIKHKQKFIILSLFILAVAGAVGAGWLFSQGADNQSADSHKIKVTLYKSPNCGCCVKYVSYLKKQGFEVETVATRDMSSIKHQHNIPRQMESCHTAIIGDYFIEGHVPLEAINKLLKERPTVDGIALPNMPAGTPGMPGIKQGKWMIYGLKDGEYANYLSL